jgi:hypothetical protein
MGQTDWSTYGTIPAVLDILPLNKSTRIAGMDLLHESSVGVEERPVPRSDVRGEQASATKPFPLKPAPLSCMTFDPAKDLAKVTLVLRLSCPAMVAW